MVWRIFAARGMYSSRMVLYDAPVHSILSLNSAVKHERAEEGPSSSLLRDNWNRGKYPSAGTLGDIPL